jgi:tight adherence protein B
MSSAWVLTCGAAAWTAACLLIVDAVYGRRGRVRRRIEQAARATAAPAADGTSLFRGWDQSAESAENALARLRRLVQQSGLPLELSHLVLASGGLALFGAGCGWLLAPHWAIAAALGTFGLAAPMLVVCRQRARRVSRLLGQLPEAFDIMLRSVQAGQTVPSAFQLVAGECRDPLASEFKLCCEQQNLGLPHDAALRDLARRVPVVELHIFVIALMVQRHCGGSPVEVLRNMSDLVRKRLRLANRVRALTGEGRMQAIVLTVLPIAAFLWLAVTRPEYIQTLIERPKLLGGVVLAQIVGTIWIRRTIRIDY